MEQTEKIIAERSGQEDASPTQPFTDRQRIEQRVQKAERQLEKSLARRTPPELIAQHERAVRAWKRVLIHYDKELHLMTETPRKAVEGRDEWVMVPRRLTPEMITAWSDTSPSHEPLACLPDDEVNAVFAQADWTAMISASPSATPASAGADRLRTGLAQMDLAVRVLTKASLTPDERCGDALAVLKSARAAFSALDLAAPSPATQEPVAWRCFHCDDTFTSEREARMHFGRDDGCAPACQIKGSEGGLIEALRRAEQDAADAWAAIHAESTDAAKGYQAQAGRHQQQLTAVEQAGYDRGLADAKAHPEVLGLARAALAASPGAQDEEGGR